VSVPQVALARPPRQSGRVRHVGAWLGAGWLVVVVLLSLTVQWWSSWGVNQQDITDVLKGPSATHWLGTDDLGRDVLTRLFASGATTIGTALLAVAVAFAIGVPVALIAAEREGWSEKGLSRVAEILLSLPSTVVLLAVVGVFGTRLAIVMTVLGVLLSAAVYRVMLGSARSAHRELYVDAARVDGLTVWRVNLRHIVPTLLPTIAVQASLLFAVSLLIESGLAFLGFGPSPPAPSWGAMIALASTNIYGDPWLMVPTGLVLALTVMSANAIGDGLGRRARQGAQAVPAASEAVARSTAASSDARDEDLARDGEDSILWASDLVVSVEGGPDLVTGVSLALPPGRVLGLVGESGCGKTMTALALLGLCPPGVRVTSGSVEVAGQAMDSLSEKGRRQVLGRVISYVSQEPTVALDPMFSVGYQLTQPIRRMRGVSRSEARVIAADLLARVGIVDPRLVLKRYPHQLSGGMAQRVAIALALSGSPQILVADEPTTALDVTVQAELLSLFRSLVADTGLAIMLVTHDLGVVADVCDDVAVMYAGQVVERGTVREVLDRPRHPYTQALLSADPHVANADGPPTRLPTIAGQVPPPEAWTPHCRFAPRCEHARAACAVPVALVRQGDVLVRCVRSAELDEARHPVGAHVNDGGARGDH
jgi:peptide/nickel transport system permease protein